MEYNKNYRIQTTYYTKQSTKHFYRRFTVGKLYTDTYLHAQKLRLRQSIVRIFKYVVIA